ncbi:cytochrome c3 family protein [Tropicibacter oceani]|uniref:Cytochrome c3 family protein n=1 Tax=Tropicibacter oceani TaxID=3058420 RepID=A0ABY8QHI6_9RHOB|nr:cytochrome c3 family protein [Tropicibacter oceani]WGW04114.1 cytochrome c3 family protein [Tropicibacter oceani]
MRVPTWARHGMAAMAMLSLSGAALSQETGDGAAPHLLADTHVDMGLDCTACHQGSAPPQAVGSAVCKTCHGTFDALANRTAEIEPNPHASHKGEQACETCHRAHEPSVDACAQCHMWGFKVP